MKWNENLHKGKSKCQISESIEQFNNEAIEGMLIQTRISISVLRGNRR